MRPPGEESGGGEEAGATLGTMRVGNYELRVGGAGGTIVEAGTGATDTEDEALARALQAGAEGEKSAADVVGDTVDDAAAVTGKVERAIALGEGAAKGKVLDPDQLSLEVDSLLALLERLELEGRSREALRLARALSTLVSLVKRWLALLRALRAALRAAEKLGDLKAVAWAKHELGSLQLVAGDVSGAERNLREALEIRERIGDRAGAAATARNTQALCKRLRGMVREKELVRRRGGRSTIRLSPVLALALAGALAVGGIAGAALGDGGGGGEPGGVSGETPSDGSNRQSEQPGDETHSLTVIVNGPGGVSSKPAGVECSTGTTSALRSESGQAETRFTATSDGVATEEESTESKLPEAGEPSVEESGIEEGQTEEEPTKAPPSEEPGGEGGTIEGGPSKPGSERPATTSCSHSFNAGSTVVLTADAGPGVSIQATDNCDPVSQTECRVVLDGDQEVTVTFRSID